MLCDERHHCLETTELGEMVLTSCNELVAATVAVVLVAGSLAKGRSRGKMVASMFVVTAEMSSTGCISWHCVLVHPKFEIFLVSHDRLGSIARTTIL